MKSNLIDSITEKKVVFVSTKNLDYIRNTQEISLIKNSANSCKVIAFSTKNYALRVLKVYFSLLAVLIKRQYDVLFLGFSPQLLFFIFPFLPKNKMLIIDFFISVYDTLIDDRKKFKDGSIFAKLFHKLDSYIIHKADLVISDTDAHRKYFAQEFHVSLSKIEVLYIQADTTIYQENLEIQNKKNANRFDVIYFGSILPVQGIEIILDAIKLMKDNDSIRFTVIGPIVEKYNVNPDDYPNTNFIPWLSQTELAKKIAEADLALAGHFSSTVGKANRTIAGKTYIYKAMNKPVILGDSDANRELFEEDNIMNFYVERGNPEALAEKIVSVKTVARRAKK